MNKMVIVIQSDKETTVAESKVPKAEYIGVGENPHKILVIILILNMSKHIKEMKMKLIHRQFSRNYSFQRISRLPNIPHMHKLKICNSNKKTW